MALLLAALCGCSSPRYYADIPEPTAPAPAPSSPAGEEWVVKAGDTLYSIAFSAGLDWRDVASGNGISPPYTIYPGQRIRLASGALQQGVEPDPPEGADGTVARTLAAPDAGPGITVSATPSPPVSQVPEAASVPPAGASVEPSPAPATTLARSAAPPAPATERPATRVVRNGAWQWPADGKLLRGFSGGAQPHKGVDIAGAMGDPVYAVNGGTVVYAGSGVRGYGNLLIVKHDAQYLSAYAHNSRLLVKEGEVVSGGQRIAEIGDSGADRVKLHFELRRQGNPVDPLKVLPGR